MTEQIADLRERNASLNEPGGVFMPQIMPMQVDFAEPLLALVREVLVRAFPHFKRARVPRNRSAAERPIVGFASQARSRRSASSAQSFAFSSSERFSRL